MAKQKSASKTPFYKTGPLYIINEDKNPTDPSPKSNPKKNKVVKKATVIKPSTKKKVTVGYDRFANYRNVPGFEPVGFAANDTGVTMMDKNGHTFTHGFVRSDRRSKSKKNK